jgi:hypothetical protein
MQPPHPKRSLGNLSAVNIPPAPLRSALVSGPQLGSGSAAYPFGYQAPLELHQRKRSIALIPNRFSVAAQQHEEFLRQWQLQQRGGKHKKLFSRAATLDYEGDSDEYEEEFLEYPEVCSKYLI